MRVSKRTGDFMPNAVIEKERLRNIKLYDKIMTAHDASCLIKDEMVIAVSGFTPTGYPKEVPLALAKRIIRDNNKDFKITLYSGASLGPEIDETWAEAGIIKKRLPYQTCDKLCTSINDGTVDFLDMHLSHSAQYVEYGMLPRPDIAIVEAVAIDAEGNIIPTLGIGNTPSFIKNASSVIVEINTSKSLEFEGMADIYMPEGPPNRMPIPLTKVNQRIGHTSIKCGLDKIAAIVFTNMQDKTRTFTAPDKVSEKISNNIICFLKEEVNAGRLPKNLLPIQSGVGNVANAVLYGLMDTEFEGLQFFTEVVQDSMLELLRSGKAINVSTTAISPSPEELIHFENEIGFFKDKIILRPQEISNNPELIRRLGIIAMNTAIEIDIYGNVNSTHIAGSKMVNGIGGSGDFTRNGLLSIFSTPSTAKNGCISSIVPFVSHVDHTEHDVMVVVTEHGYADLRGLCPKERAIKIINNCAEPMYRMKLLDYYDRACKQGANHTPHIIGEALSWHKDYLENGTMK